MSNFFTARLVGLDIGVESRCASVCGLYSDYLSDAPPVFTVRADSTAVRRQRELSEEPVTEEYAEALVLYGADGKTAGRCEY